jgi:hypothetical protein
MKLKVLFLLIIILLVGCTSIMNNNTDTNIQINTREDTTTLNNSSNENIAVFSPTETNNDLLVGNTPGNINNFGLVAFDDEWEYFWAGTTHQTDYNGGKLCKIKRDGTCFQVISDVIPCYINISDEWIYYIKQKKPGTFKGSIFKIRKDGKENQIIFQSDCVDMTVVGEWIYFINESEGNRIFKVKTDGSGLMKINDNECFGLLYENDTLYYFTKTGEYADTLNKQDVSAHSSPIQLIEGIFDFIINKGWIYFTTDDALYRLKTDGTDKTCLTDKSIINFNVLNDYIIISCVEVLSDDINDISVEFYKMNLDGSNMNKIPYSEKTFRSHIAGLTDENVYYWVDCAEWVELARMKYDGTSDFTLIKLLD